MTDNSISIGKAAEILGVTKLTMLNWEKSGKVQSYKTFGGHRRYLESYIYGLQRSQNNLTPQEKNATTNDSQGSQ